jgi:guanylate kinase
MEEFPEIPANHIYMGSRKDKIDVDILFDDGAHNVFASNAAYPILMRRPWNREATGILAVNTYDEFLKLVEVISDSYSVRQTQYSLKEPSVIVLVGPSGSRKNDIMRDLVNSCTTIERLPSYTTVEQMNMFTMDRYKHISEQEFLQMHQQGELFESTNYANHFYGSRKGDVEEILARGKHVRVRGVGQRISAQDLAPRLQQQLVIVKVYCGGAGIADLQIRDLVAQLGGKLGKEERGELRQRQKRHLVAAGADSLL